MPATPSGARGAVITGWGTALPNKILTNIDLESMMDTDTCGFAIEPESRNVTSAAQPQDCRPSPDAPLFKWPASTPLTSTR